jgi:hypothetical protein
MPMDRSASTAPPPLVAIVSWLVPGAGYFLLGQRARALTIGITIIALFVLGLLVAGVRVLEVPGYDAHGQEIMVPVGRDVSGNIVRKWVMLTSPLSEIRDKPWSVPQVLTGPISLAAAAWSVYESAPDPQDPLHARGAQSHSRINEIGSLYLSVAGLLNLMAIIDVSYRAAGKAKAG